MGLVYYNYVFHYSEYYPLNSPYLSIPVIAGITYQYPEENQIIFFEKKGIFIYKISGASPINNISSISDALKEGNYQIDPETDKIIFQNGQYYYFSR